MGPYNGNATQLWEAGYWENEHCFPTGDAQCSFRFFDIEGNELIVVTHGEAFNGDFQWVRVSAVRRNPNSASALQ
jgi:hypothetical protein